jgi:hypothetical protein
MKDAIDTLMTDFGKFAQEHAGFSGYVDSSAHRAAADKQWSERKRERPERYVGESTAIPDAEGAVLLTSRHGSRVYGAIREEEIECGCWCRAGTLRPNGVS